MLPSRGTIQMKRKLLTTLSITVATILLGYLFFLGWLGGLLASKYLAGDSTGKRGKLGSIIIPLRRWGIHLHHWLYSLCLLGISLVTGIHFLSPTITYGLLGGIAFQGVYYYRDWHVILVKESRTRTKDRRTKGSPGKQSLECELV